MTRQRQKPKTLTPEPFVIGREAFAKISALRFFEERCTRQGIFIFDEPESALSPSRQVEFLKLLRRMDQSGRSQVIMATHSPLLMAYPGACLLQLSKYGLAQAMMEETDQYRLMREFFADPPGFVATMLGE